MELKHESITLSSLVRRALNPTCSILICFSREGGGVLAPGFLRSLYRRVQGILRSLFFSIPNHKKLRRNGSSEIFLFASNLSYFRSENRSGFWKQGPKTIYDFRVVVSRHTYVNPRTYKGGGGGVDATPSKFFLSFS